MLHQPRDGFRRRNPTFVMAGAAIIRAEYKAEDRCGYFPGALPMNKLQTAFLSSLIGCSYPVLADDSPSSKPVATHTQKMQACMTKQKASNTGLSKDEMK